MIVMMMSLVMVMSRAGLERWSCSHRQLCRPKLRAALDCWVQFRCQETRLQVDESAENGDNGGGGDFLFRGAGIRVVLRDGEKCIFEAGSSYNSYVPLTISSS